MRESIFDCWWNEMMRFAGELGFGVFSREFVAGLPKPLPDETDNDYLERIVACIRCPMCGAPIVSSHQAAGYLTPVLYVCERGHHVADLEIHKTNEGEAS